MPYTIGSPMPFICPIALQREAFALYVDDPICHEGAQAAA